jgi:transposase
VKGGGGGVVTKAPEVILDEPHEQIVQRVCAVDVAKDSGKVCVRVPAETGSGRRVSKVWDVRARTNAIIELGDHLACQGIEKVTLESTSDYWRIWYYLLEARGLDVQLVNARDVKNVPGRPKTDKLDSMWLAKLTEKGLLRPSFVPPRPIRVLRDYTRLRVDLTAERVRHWQRLEKLLEDALIKITSVASRIDLLSVRDMLEALIAGQRNPRVLAGMARGRMRLKHADLVEALTGQFDDHHAELARMLLDQIDALTDQIDTLTVRINAVLADLPNPPPRPEPDPDDHGPGPHRPAEQAPPHKGSTSGEPLPAQATTPAEITVPDLIDILDEIPGIGRHNAQEIIAEIGLDMTRFPTADHLVSWAKLCPRTIQSGRKSTAGKTGKGNRYLRAVLGDAAAGAGKTQTFLGARYRRLIGRRGKLKALVAVARSILVIIWNLLSNPGMRYQDLGVDFHTKRMDIQRRTRNHVRQLEAMGYTVTLNAPAA